MKKSNQAARPAQNTICLRYYPDAAPGTPEYDCGVTYNLPENLYRPYAEVRRVYKAVITDGTQADRQTVERWLAYEINSRRGLSDRKARTEFDALTKRRALWYKLTGQTMPDDSAADTDTAAESGTTNSTTENQNSQNRRNNTMTHFDFFAGCSTVDEARARYYKLAQLYHPDHESGDDAAMAEINDQFSAFIGRDSAAADAVPGLPAGVIALPEHCETPEAAAETEEFIKAVSVVVTLPGISAELCGAWIWVSGDTKPVKDSLKAAGYRFNGKKAMWYWRPADITPRRRYRGAADMDYIRGKYGSRAIKTQSDD